MTAYGLLQVVKIHCARMIIHEEGILGLGQGLAQLLCAMGQTRLPCSQLKMLLRYFCGRNMKAMGKSFNHGNL